MIRFELQGDTELVAKLDAIPAKLRSDLVRRVSALSVQMEALVKRKLSGQALNVRSGNLRDSIVHDVDYTGSAVSGAVFSDNSVKYGRIHEYGGTTRPHVIEPKDPDGVLAFKVGGRQVFARRVNHPGSKIPARPFMRPSLEEMKPKILASFQEAAAKAIE